MRKSGLNKFVVQSRKYWWLILGAVVILGLAIGLVVLVNTENQSEEVEVVEVTEIEPVETEEGVRFTNAEFVEKFIGEVGAKVAVADVEKGVYEFLNEGSYTAFAAGSDVEKGVSFPFNTLEFVLQVSNGENFDVQIALLKDAYFGVLVGPANGEKAKLMVEYIRPGAEAGYSEEEAVAKLRDWATGVRPGANVVTEIQD